MHIALIYFSGTGNTKKISNVIKEKLINLDNEIEEFNLANRSVRQNLYEFEQFKGIIFGFPIYYWRAPRLVREWLKTKDGKSHRCSVFFTYGGVHTGISHNNIKQLLESNNFIMVASAEFLAKHTFSIAGFHFMEDHPNDEDFRIAREFASISFDKFLKKEVNSFSIDLPFTKSEEEVDKIELIFRRATPTPFIDLNLCTECGLCEKLCPTNAMEIIKGKARRSDCIRCLRCLTNCLENAIIMPSMTSHYKYIKNSLRLTEDVLESRKSKIYF